MFNNYERIFKSGKTYIAGKDFAEGLIELKPLVRHTSGTHYEAKDFEAKHTYGHGGVFEDPEYITLSKGSTLELYVDVILNTYTREDHMVFSTGCFYEAGEDFRAGLVRISNRINIVSISIHDGDTFEKIQARVASADSEIYLTIEKGQLLMVHYEGTELLELVPISNDKFRIENKYIPSPDKFSSRDILYIYKGDIRCHRYNHNIIQATAILHSRTDKEIELNVEFCTNCQKFLLEYTLFEEYRRRYGVLVGNFRMVVNGEFDGEYDLAEESPLMLSGYNVSQKDGYTSAERHYILARIIHDGIMEKGDVIRYLSYFIRKNGAKRGNELALSKWREDLAFVQSYNSSIQPRTIITDIRRY